MTNNLGGIYRTGTLSVDANGTVFTGSGTLWSIAAEQGDWIFANGHIAIITEAITDTSLVSESPWTGGALVASQYLLIKMSWLRYEPAITQQKVRDLLADLSASGTFIFVAGAVPDDADGSDGQWALKIDDGSWTLWYKVSGSWVLQGTPVGIDLAGTYNPATDYLIGKTVSWQGKLWRGLVSPNVGNQPDTSPTQWEMVLSGGDQYDITFFDTDMPASAELIDKKYPNGVTFYVGLATSYASAEIASTGTAVFSFKKNGTTFATLTFSAGNLIGVFACATQTTFGAADKYTMVAPTIRDITLSGVGGNIIGYR